MPITALFRRHGLAVTRSVSLALALPVALALSGCATNFDANVSRFSHELPAPAGQTFAVVAEDPRNSGGLEFGQYASLVADQLRKAGYVQGDAATSDLVVEFDYGVDKGRDKVSVNGPYDPFWGMGWYDPWFNDVDVTTVYTSGIELKIKRRSDGSRLFEGKAEAVSPSNRLPYLVPNLIDALFTGFPGHSGETVHISVPGEKNKKK